MSRPQFFLVAGPNGAGKSTLTLSIKNRFPNVEVIDPDAIAKEITGSYATIEQEQLSAGRRTLEIIRQHIHSQQPFLAESTISGAIYIKLAELAKQKNFRTVFIYIALNSAQLSADRVAKRTNLGGHHIPIEDINRRFPRSLKNLKSHIKAFDSAHIYDNSVHYQWIAGYRNGQIHNSAKNIPKWLKPYLP